MTAIKMAILLMALRESNSKAGKKFIKIKMAMAIINPKYCDFFKFCTSWLSFYGYNSTKVMPELPRSACPVSLRLPQSGKGGDGFLQKPDAFLDVAGFLGGHGFFTQAPGRAGVMPCLGGVSQGPLILQYKFAQRLCALPG
jgi:hypothetical protein